MQSLGPVLSKAASTLGHSLGVREPVTSLQHCSAHDLLPRRTLKFRQLAQGGLEFLIGSQGHGHEIDGITLIPPSTEQFRLTAR